MPLGFGQKAAKPELKHIKRCPAETRGQPCNSAVFYDWGLELLDTRPTQSVLGGELERFRGYVAGGNRVKICALCNTPYYIEAGDLVDLSDELSPEDIRAIISRGQMSLPHPFDKDP